MKKTLVILLTSLIIVISLATLAYGEEVRLDVKIPFQMTGKQGVALAGSEVSAYFFLENQVNKQIEAKIAILLPPEMEPEKLGSSWQVEQKETGYILENQAKLAAKLDNWFDLVTLRVKPNVQPGLYPVEVTTTYHGKSEKKKFLVKVADGKEVQKLLGITALHIPTNEDGKIEGKYKENTLILKEINPNRWRNMVQGGQKGQRTEGMDFIPICYLGVDLYNRGQEEISVLITSQLLHPVTRKPVAGFALPSYESNTENNDRIYSLVTVLPGEMRVPLPLYGEAGEITGGKYLLSTSLRLLGSEKILATKEIEVQVVEKDPWPGRIVLTTFVLLSLAFAFLLQQQKKLFKRFKTKWLIMIALFGTATFVTVNIPGTILGDFAHVLLGPFSFLITGLFNQVLLYMLLISLVILIPHPGVILLLTAVRTLLNGMVLGHFTPLSFLFYFSGAFLLEAALYLTDVTKGRKNSLLNITQVNFSPQIWLVALGCGIAEVAASFLNFQAFMFLYRLYYANWYIWVYLLVNALFYTMIGVFLGLLLGKQLKKITD